jgi:hypothetical protein
MNKHYYVIKTLMRDLDLWDDDAKIYHYVYGTSSYFQWSPFPADARKFKSITEIRTFITRGLKRTGNNHDINSWVFEGIFTVPSSDIITAVHTMGLLRSVK